MPSTQGQTFFFFLGAARTGALYSCPGFAAICGSSVATAITMGAAVYYDAGAGVITTTSASNVPAGYAAAAADANDATVLVKLLG